MGLADSPFFAVIRPLLKVQWVNDSRRPRFRIEVLPAPIPIIRQALAFTMPCVACGELIHPFRQRHPGNPYFAAACPVTVSPGCSKGSRATNEYRRVADALEGKIKF